MSVVFHDRYDQLAYRDAGQLHPSLSQAAKQLGSLSAELAEDLFYSFYQLAPSLASEETLSPSEQVYHKLISEIMNTTEWDTARASGTIGDQVYSAMAASSVTKSILKNVEKKILDNIEQLRSTEEEIARLYSEAETYEDLAKDATGDKAQELYDKAKAARVRAEDLEKQSEQTSTQIEGQAEKLEDQTRQAARGSLSVTESDIESMQATVKTFGQGSAMTTKEKIQLATSVGKSDKLKKIAELTGRMNRIALQVQKSKVKHPPDEIVGITLGKDLGKVLPIELVQLADPDLEPLFFKKYVEGQLMQLDMRGSEKQGRGPIIVSIDSSGSMTKPLGNTTTTKEVWSKAVMLALLGIARKQKRDFAAIHFSGGTHVKMFEFSKGEADPRQLIAAADYFSGGGTQYEEWMARSLKLVESSKFNRADVICISDGEVYISDELEKNWNRRRKAKEMRCYSVLLGDEQGGHELSRISDAIANIDDLKDDNSALDMMFSV